jgi:hypothetical protein
VELEEQSTEPGDSGNILDLVIQEERDHLHLIMQQQVVVAVEQELWDQILIQEELGLADHGGVGKDVTPTFGAAPQPFYGPTSGYFMQVEEGVLNYLDLYSLYMVELEDHGGGGAPGAKNPGTVASKQWFSKYRWRSRSCLSLERWNRWIRNYCF